MHLFQYTFLWKDVKIQGFLHADTAAVVYTVLKVFHRFRLREGGVQYLPYVHGSDGSGRFPVYIPRRYISRTAAVPFSE